MEHGKTPGRTGVNTLMRISAFQHPELLAPPQLPLALSQGREGFNVSSGWETFQWDTLCKKGMMPRTVTEDLLGARPS